MNLYLILYHTLKEALNEKKSKPLFLAAILVLILGISLRTLTPLVFKYIIELYPRYVKETYKYLVIYGFMWLINQLLTPIEELLSHRIKERMLTRTVLTILSKLFQLPMSFFIEQRIGVITNVITRMKKNLAVISWGIIFYLVPLTIEIIAVTVILICYLPLYCSLLMISILLLFSFYTICFSKYASKYRNQAIKNDKESDAIIIDYIQNYLLIRTLWLNDYIYQNLKINLDEREDKQVKSFAKFSYIYLGQAAILGLGFMILLTFLGSDLAAGNISFSAFILFHGYLLNFIVPVKSLGYIMRDIKRATLDMYEGINILTENISNRNRDKFIEIKNGYTGIIEFQDVTVKHEGEVILDNISFRINSGERVILVGETGSGKSTLIKLILGVYQPDEGKILINGNDIKEINLKSISSLFGFIPQEVNLLNTSIYENVKLAKLDSLRSEVVNSMKKANLFQSLHELSNRSFLVGERGSKLSGGEKQRISFARLFLKNAPICLLDEPTSFFDYKTLKQIFRNLETYLEGKTSLIITHDEMFFTKYDKKLMIKNKKLYLFESTKEVPKKTVN